MGTLRVLGQTLVFIFFFFLICHCLFYPLAIKALGYSDHQRRAVRNSALTKKLADEVCLFFTDMTYVPGQFIPYIFLAP